MAFPEFDAGTKKILFFTRGRGRGHAIPDIEIVRELSSLRDDFQLRFASYGTGADTLSEFKQPLIDLGLPDRNPINETVVLAGKLIGWLDPDLVVAHEEFPALSAAKIFDKPTAFITDWFSDPKRYTMESLRLADDILFVDEEGVYDEPDFVVGRVHYVGPIVRNFEYQRADRQRAREEFGLPAEALVIAVLPGSWREADAPILDLVLETYDRLEASPRRMVWLAGEDTDLIREKTAGRDDVLVKSFEPRIDRIMVAADVAITKGTRNVLNELNALGIPCVPILLGVNPVDDLRAGKYVGAKPLVAADATPQVLVEALEQAHQLDVEPDPPPPAAADAARLISEFLDRASAPES